MAKINPFKLNMNTFYIIREDGTQIFDTSEMDWVHTESFVYESLDTKKFCATCIIIATISPNAVVNSAWDIPPATTAGEISLAIFISSKACI